jgi:hypothetical protein
MRGSRFSLMIAVGVVGLGAALAMAQTSTTKTSQSQSGSGSSSSKATASASASGGASASGSASGGQSGSAMASGTTVELVKGHVYLVRWLPVLNARNTQSVVSAHKQFVKERGAELGVLMDGAIGGDEPGLLSIVQGQFVRDFVSQSPLTKGQAATFQVIPYSIDYSRVGVIKDVVKTEPIEEGKKSGDGG